MAWIELHQTLPRHPKLLRLANRLRVHPAQAAGHLTFLWLWALDYAPHGDVSALAPAEISAAACFPGDAELFAKALGQCGWVDPDGQIHDWADYAGRIVTMREGNRDRQRRSRARHALRHGDPPVSHAPVTGLPNTTQPNPTKEEDEDEKGARATAPAPVSTSTPPIEPPAGFPRSEEEARQGAALWAVSPEVAVRAWTLAASRGWRDARDVPIRSWHHHVAHCQAVDRDRQQQDRQRPGAVPKGRTPSEQRQIQESIPLPIHTVT